MASGNGVTQLVASPLAPGQTIKLTASTSTNTELLVATGNDVYRTVSTMPGVSTLGRFTNRGAEPPREEKPPRRRASRSKPQPT